MAIYVHSLEDTCSIRYGDMCPADSWLRKRHLTGETKIDIGYRPTNLSEHKSIVNCKSDKSACWLISHELLHFF